MSHTKSLSTSRHRPSRSFTRLSTAILLAASTPALLTLFLRPIPAAATASPSPLLPTSSDALDSPLLSPKDALEGPSPQLDSETLLDSLDLLNRRKHVTFQSADQPQAPPASNHLDSSLDDAAFPVALRYDHLPSIRLESAPRKPLDVPSSFQSDSSSFPLSDDHAYGAQESSGRSELYNQDLIGKQTGSGYVFVRGTDPRPYIAGAGAALATLFSRRDIPVSRPPLVPNSNSRLLIGLVIVCIISVGVLTLAAQEMYRRLRTVGQPRSPLRRRSGDGRTTRTLYRNDSTHTLISTSGLAAPSLEEEEERIKTPQTLSRRSSAAPSSLAPSPHNENGFDADKEEDERKTHTDLHYLSLPFGIGIGYSYAHIADGGDAQTRLSRLATNKARRSNRSRSGSTLALSTGALPVPTTSAVNGTDGLRSRSRSFKELCRDAFKGSTMRDIGVISEEDDGSSMTNVSTSRWGSSLVSLDLSSSERGSGTLTPTGPSSESILPLSTSNIASEDPSLHAAPAKASTGRFFGVDAAAPGHTLIDLGLGTPELAISDPNGITRPASTPGAMPSQIARHPQVEQLRREGRSETGKRVGQGTPTNIKLY